jgi:hypothetical protein
MPSHTGTITSTSIDEGLDVDVFAIIGKPQLLFFILCFCAPQNSHFSIYWSYAPESLDMVSFEALA